MTRRTRNWSSFGVLLLLAGVCLAQTPPRRVGARQEPPAIRVEVNLVTLLASVLDKSGRPVPELPKEAFEVYEEGVRQKIAIFESETQQPLDLALMIDTSMSTFKEFQFEREAAARFIRQVVRPGDRVAVYEFSDTVTLLAGFSADVPALQAAVRRMEPGAGTAMYDAVYLGARALAERPGGRRRVIALVTDAGETTSSSTFEDARRAALRAEAMLYTILVRPVKSESGRNTAGEHALVTISDVSGGAMYYPDSVHDFEAIFDRIDRELRTQYRLGYYPAPRPPARSYRRVEVRAGACAATQPAARDPASPAPSSMPCAASSDYAVRYRKGYFTAGALD